MTSLTIVTYNIHGGRAPAALARVVAALAPDVLVVNEAPRMPLVGRWRCNRMAAQWGLRRVAGGRDAGQNMLCVSSRVEIRSASARRLRQPLFEPMRGIVTAQCAVNGVEFGVVGVHLSLVTARRPTEAWAAIADAQRLRGPVMVCGDLNEISGHRAWQVFEQAGFADRGRADDSTFSSTDRRKRIDAILVKGGRVSSHGVPAELEAAYGPASDHCPVRAVVELSA